MSTTMRLRTFFAVLVLGVSVLLQDRASAALTNNVPLNWWNATPSFTNGAYLEDFDAVPNWASVAGQTNSSVTDRTGPFPSRSNVWFAATAATNVLLLNGNTTVTNAFTNTAGNVSFATNTVFVDMKFKFTALADSDVPSAAALQSCKCVFYVNATSNLVAAVYGTPAIYTTNTIPLDLSKWYQVTVKMQTNCFTVLTNDVAAFPWLPLYNASVPSALSAMAISGAGSLDELYVSYGNPAYPGPIGITGFPGAGGVAVTNWLTGYFNDGRLSAAADFSGLTSAQLDAAYLLGELGGTASTPTPVNYAFGVSSIDVTSPTSVTVVCQLLTGGSLTPKSGVINGGIQLQGKQNWADGSWTSLSDVVTPTFVNGTASCTFTVDAGYRFFHPQIVPLP